MAGTRSSQDALRRLPSVDRLLQGEAASRWVAALGRDLVVEACREALEAERRRVLSGEAYAGEEALWADVVARLQATVQPTLRPVINASGVVIQTNLGRSPLSEATLDAMRRAGEGYSNLEYDLAAGERGSRYVHAEALLTRLTGAEAGLLVNNNAGAVLLALSALARGREVIISRGQLVEIGGGFRIPDVMAQSGARLVEVGTTNRTYASDYRAAITDETAAQVAKAMSAQPGMSSVFPELTTVAGAQAIRLTGSMTLKDPDGEDLTNYVTTYMVPSERAGGFFVSFYSDVEGDPRGDIAKIMKSFDPAYDG